MQTPRKRTHRTFFIFKDRALLFVPMALLEEYLNWNTVQTLLRHMTSLEDVALRSQRGNDLLLYTIDGSPYFYRWN
jgi:hypothetical protein